MDLLVPLIALAVGLALGAVIGALLGPHLGGRGRASTQAASIDPAVVEARHAQALSELRAEEQAVQARIAAEAAGLQATVEGLRRQVADSQAQYRELVDRTREDAEARAQAERAESKVVALLTPVQESLRSMQKQVTDLELQRTQQHGELAQQLRASTESEERLRMTAESLASALRNNATRGVWGETQLRSVVEAAGMLERVNFDVQSSIRIDNKAARPDMVVHLPGGKNIAVDAKVPFNSYLEAMSILASAEPAEAARRESLMKAHVKALRDHITALGSRSYWDGLEASPEMVVAFIPSEALLSSALENDASLMDFAFSKNVALASPVTLFSVLKAVAVSWRHEVVTKEAKELFDVSRELYTRITTLATHVDKLGRSIERSVKDYNSFVGSLERQVLPSARRISQMDESKVLPALGEISEDTRQLTSSDLTAAVEAELRSLDETGIARPEIDPALVAPALATPDGSASIAAAPTLLDLDDAAASA